MALKINKRQQARNERTLQDLIKSVPGNDRCADCFARNPGWASWNLTSSRPQLGIFLCMRCAALHRKLGTHVSKVKSLSMDSWSLEQVENIKKVGNAVSNRQYNPRNAKPNIPVDADEVDGAMERYIRDKYLHQSLSNEKPQSPQESRHHTGSSSSSNDVPPPPPPKPGQRFGSNVRSVTSPIPRMDAPLPSPPASIKTDRTGASSGETRRMARIPETESSSARGSFDYELRNLRDMGFHDDKKNIAVLHNFNGDLGRTVETLVRLRNGATGAGSPTVQIQGNGMSFEGSRSRSSSALVNGISYEQPAQHSTTSNNPFGPSPSLLRASSDPQQLEASFQNMNLSNVSQTQVNSNAYANNQNAQHISQSNPFYKPMTPPTAPSLYSFNASSQSVGSSPQQQYSSDFSGQNYPLRQSRSQQNFSTSNPFALNMTTNGIFQSMYQPQQQTHYNQSQYNQSQQWQQQNQSPQLGFGWQNQQQNSSPPPTSQATYQQNLFQNQDHSSMPPQSPPPPNEVSYGYSQQPQQYQQQQQQQLQQPMQISNMPMGNMNQHQQQNGFQTQYYPQWNSMQQQQHQLQQQPSQPQPLRPQATGLNKASILALYNAPSPAFSQSATASPASTSNSTDISSQAMYSQQTQMPQQPQQYPQQAQPQSQEEFRPVPISARSVTMPLPAANQNGGSNNPFGKGHVSRESMLFTGAGSGGRASPDAFSGFSARVGWGT
ncbi:MAG: hypothetical protein M1828_003900 [Chrysothrix sp. TS-e1954]|nr:MAG: hypothetical protein M1828_003900 [Chrysothrix sp. TS-e1954]